MLVHRVPGLRVMPDNLRYVFNWNKKRFPDPEGFFREMHARGINVIPNLKPGILKRHPYMDLFEEQGVFIRTRIRLAR